VREFNALKFIAFGVISWLNPNDVNNLRSLLISSCTNLETLSTQGGSRGQHASWSTNCSNGILSSLAFTHLTTVSLVSCSALKNLDQFLPPKNLPSVESIVLKQCYGLKSVPAEFFAGFVQLKDLKLCHCSSLVCSSPSQEMVLPPSLQRLCIVSCAQIERAFLSCLEKLTSLTVLSLIQCDYIKSIPLHSITCRNKLKFLLLGHCMELSIGESGIPSSIDYVELYCCPNS
jgi:hypothetical protein